MCVGVLHARPAKILVLKRRDTASGNLDDAPRNRALGRADVLSDPQTSFLLKDPRTLRLLGNINKKYAGKGT